MRFSRWLRSKRGKSSPSDWPSSEASREFGEPALTTWAKTRDQDKGPSLPYAPDRQEPFAHQGGTKRPASRLANGHSRASYGREEERRHMLGLYPPDLRKSQTPKPISDTIVPTRPDPDGPLPPNSAEGRKCAIVEHPYDPAARCTCFGPWRTPPQSPCGPDTPASLPQQYASRAGSEESVLSEAVPSSDPASELVACESIVLEEADLRAFEAVARSITLDPLFMTAESSLPLEAQRSQGQVHAELVSQNADDLQRQLLLHLDFQSLSEAWRSGLRAPIESSS